VLWVVSGGKEMNIEDFMFRYLNDLGEMGVVDIFTEYLKGVDSPASTS